MGIPNLDKVNDLLKKVGNRVSGVKIHDLWDQYGWNIVDSSMNVGASQVWADLKLHDIPQTVQFRVSAILCAGARIISVHASGGLDMMRASLQILGEFWIAGITALTSLSEEEVHLI